MTENNMEALFFREGYRVLHAEPEEIRVFYKYYEEGFHVVMLVDMEHGHRMTAGQHKVLEERVKSLFFHPQGKLSDFPDGFPVYHVETLTLLMGRENNELRSLSAQLENTWVYLTNEKRLFIYENQPGDFWGLRNAVENMNPAEDFQGKRVDPVKKTVNGIKYIPFATIGLVLLNVIVYIVLECMGDTENALYIAAHGGLYPNFILYDHQWWRILTSGFIHFGIQHLVNNMIIFACVGSRLERAVGHVRLVMIYLIALIGGGMLSYFVMVYTGDYAVAAGASGAVFGTIGALLWVVIWHRGRFEGLTTRGLVFMILLSLYYGISTIGVDNWAHAGGILAGFTAAVILYHRKSQKY